MKTTPHINQGKCPFLLDVGDGFGPAHLFFHYQYRVGGGFPG